MVRTQATIIHHAPPPTPLTQRQIFLHGERVDQLEMLVHHPDAGRDRVARRGKLRR